VNGKRVVLLPGAETLHYTNYRQFLLGSKLTVRALDAAFAGGAALRDKARDVLIAPAPRPGAATAEAIPALTVAGAAIDAISKLGSYFMTDYESGGISLSPDAEQLTSAVAGSLLKLDPPPSAVVLPGRQAPRSDELEAIIRDLADKVLGVDTAASNAEEEAKRQRRLGELNAADKDKHLRAAGFCDSAAELLRKALLKAEAFIATLAVADSKGVALIAKIALEKAIADEAGKADALSLALDVRAAAGGYYTKKNLWTFFGFMPFYVMGGAVVTYQLVDKDGVLKGAGTVPVHAGYSNVKKVELLFKR
jgi:hypothetical protein